MLGKFSRGVARNGPAAIAGLFGLSQALEGDVMGGAAGGALAGARFGPLGALAGGAIGLTTAIVATAINTEKTAEELEAEREAKETERRKQEAENAKQLDQLTFMAQYLRRNMNETRISDPKTQDLITKLIREAIATRQALEENNNNPSVTPN
jgi:hypothetical protein